MINSLKASDALRRHFEMAAPSPGSGSFVKGDGINALHWGSSLLSQRLKRLLNKVS